MDFNERSKNPNSWWGISPKDHVIWCLQILIAIEMRIPIIPIPTARITPTIHLRPLSRRLSRRSMLWSNIVIEATDTADEMVHPLIHAYQVEGFVSFWLFFIGHFVSYRISADPIFSRRYSRHLRWMNLIYAKSIVADKSVINECFKIVIDGSFISYALLSSSCSPPKAYWLSAPVIHEFKIKIELSPHDKLFIKPFA